MPTNMWYGHWVPAYLRLQVPATGGSNDIHHSTHGTSSRWDWSCGGRCPPRLGGAGATAGASRQSAPRRSRRPHVWQRERLGPDAVRLRASLRRSEWHADRARKHDSRVGPARLVPERLALGAESDRVLWVLHFP